jgi:dihydroneopterin aldolase/2-amino-4-hydroxy-6-hydroxymethyldihydropteridine diphosphokinase
MDEIRIEELEVFANHGVFAEEQKLGQKFVVSAYLFTDTRGAGKTDRLEQSIHYGEVCHQIQRHLQTHTYQLLERVAEALAEELLLTLPTLSKISIEIKKPWAPIGLPLKTASVRIERGWHTAYIALGSNMGEKKQYLEEAVQSLCRMSGYRVKRVSSWYETKPYGVLDQDDFLNGCLQLETLDTPEELLETLHRIEKGAGRERVVRWGPRTLDLDLLLYDDCIIQTNTLCVPHIELHKRTFVLQPLCEIAPYVHHPVYGKTVQEMLQELRESIS